MALPTIFTNSRLRVNIGGEILDLSETFRSSDAAVFHRAIISVTNAYEDLESGEVGMDRAWVRITHLGTTGYILATIDALKPSGFLSVDPGETRMTRLGENWPTVELIAIGATGAQNVEVVVVGTYFA